MTPDVLAFLTALHPDGYRELRAIRPNGKVKERQSFCFAADNVTDLVTFCDDHVSEKNVYVGVAARSRFDSTNCKALHALFVDLDFKDSSDHEVRVRLAAFPLPPSAVVTSGNGLHVYWLLTAPIDLATFSDYAKSILKALAQSLGGDMVSAEPARILRMPGTLNHKPVYPTPRPVVLTHWTGHRYALDDILAHLPLLHATPDAPPPEPVAHSLTLDQRRQMAKMWLATQSPAIEGDGGDKTTFKVCAGLVIGHDLTPDAALPLLAEWNARCQPPWDDDDLRAKLNNGTHYGTHRRGDLLRLRRAVLTLASTITPRPVHWLWQQRLPLGSLSMMSGREGIGKTTCAYWLAAQLTRGRLPGEFFGQPRTVIIAASEDSWAHTIVPRLMAADADLTKVGRVDVIMHDGTDVELTLPNDTESLKELIIENETALVVLDPVLSLLSGKIDSHKDAEVRNALTPLVRIADVTGTAFLGIMHVNKGASRDALNMVMGSRAFTAMPRAVLTVMKDPDDERHEARLLGLAKNNLGRTDLPSLKFKVVSKVVAMTEDGIIDTGAIEWLGEVDETPHDTIERTAAADRAVGSKATATAEATSWLRAFLLSRDGWATSVEIYDAAEVVGHSESAIKRAKGKLKVDNETYPNRASVWWLGDAKPGALEVVERMAAKVDGPGVQSSTI